MAFILTVAIGLRSFYAQKDANKQQAKLTQSLNETSEKLSKADATLDQSRLSQEYMKGQLSGLSMMVGKLDSDGNVGNVNLAKALRDIGSQPTHAAGIEPPAIQKMSNKQLQTGVIEFANSMRTFASEIMANRDRMTSQRMAATQEARIKDGGAVNGPLQQQAWNQANIADQNLYNQTSLRISQEYLGVATQYHEELERRLGPQKPLTGMDSMLALWSSHDPMYSDMNLTTTAIVLERMARKLPD